MYSQHLFRGARDITGKRTFLLCENMEHLQWFWFTNLSFSVNAPINVVGLALAKCQCTHQNYLSFFCCKIRRRAKQIQNFKGHKEIFINQTKGKILRNQNKPSEHFSSLQLFFLFSLTILRDKMWYFQSVYYFYIIFLQFT